MPEATRRFRGAQSGAGSGTDAHDGDAMLVPTFSCHSGSVVGIETFAEIDEQEESSVDSGLVTADQNVTRLRPSERQRRACDGLPPEPRPSVCGETSCCRRLIGWQAATGLLSRPDA